MKANDEYVSFISGGFKEKRRVLKGDEAKPTFTEIPAIDFSEAFSEDPAVRLRLAKELGKAVEEVGFFYAINAPVSTEKMDAALAAVTAFFAQSEAEKMEVFNALSPAGKGFTPVKPGGFSTNTRESYGIGNDYTEPEQQALHVAPEGSVPLNNWPTRTMPEFRSVMYDYFGDALKFGLKLVQLFALALGLEENAFDWAMKRPLTEITVQHYPARPTDDPLEVLMGHADFGILTLLLQNGVPGLQVLNANSVWIDVPPRKHAYLCNTGNYMNVWSNGRFPSTVHRVYTTSGKERLSLPFFLNPSPDVSVLPLPELVTADSPAKFTEPMHVGPRQVKGMLYNMAEHPTLLKLNELGVKPEDFSYDKISRPSEEW